MKLYRVGRFGPAAALLLLGGCSDEEYANTKTTAARSGYPPGTVVSADSYGGDAPAAASPPAAGKIAQATAPAEARPIGAKEKQAAADVSKATPRKIIYTARLTLVVESIAKLSDKLRKLVKDADGYFGTTEQSSYPQAQQTATWTIRVPVDRFDDFLASVGTFGEVQQNHLDSQDVSQEFYDTEAHILNKQKEESRLQKHLDESTGKLEDILAVERELTRVRGEIETMQGRIRYLSNQSALSTVTITATEVKDYVPPVRPTFATQIARTFQRSSENLAEFGKAVVLAVVAVAPWLPLLLVLCLLLLWLWRWVRPRSAVVLRPAEPRPS